MAKFTVSKPLRMAYYGHDLSGPPGTVHRIPDSLKAAFEADFGVQMPDLTWIVGDEIAAGGGSHPDLSGHTTIGLATQDDLDAHELAPDPHPDYALDSVVSAHGADAGAHGTYLLASEKGVANGVAALDSGGQVPDAQIPGAIARDTEVAAAVTAHEAAADPHAGYVREADANWADLTDAGETTLHTHPAGGGGAPADATYLVTTAHAGLSAEVAVGATPGGELGGTWGAPTVDASHGGGTHAAAQAAAEATAAGALSGHAAAADPHTGYQRESEKAAASGYASLDGTTKVPIAQLPTGSSGTTVAIGNDARLSDARTPLAHDIDGAAHNGFPGGTTNFLRADGTFAAPAGGGGGVTKISGNSGAFVADTTWETLTADSSGVTVTTQTTVMTVTGLGAGTYRVKGTLIWKTAATTTGIGITLNHTGTLSQFVSTWWTTTTGGAAATGIADQVTATAAGQLVEGKSERVKDTRSSFSVGTDTAGGTQLSIIEAILIVTASGDLQLKIATEVGGSAATLLAGSTLEVNLTA